MGAARTPNEITFIVWAIGFLCGACMILAVFHLVRPDPWSQASFQCAEDEVLMFIDTLTKDRVGCVAVEEVAR